MELARQPTASPTNDAPGGDPACSALDGDHISLCYQTPYLSEVITPVGKTRFTYEWYEMLPVPLVVGLHEVYTCGPSEDYPEAPSVHYAWCPDATLETRYPASVHTGTTDACETEGHWTGGLMRKYRFSQDPFDMLTSITDEANTTVVAYTYSSWRDRITVTDGNSHTTHLDYRPDKANEDGEHNLYFRTDPLGSEWSYAYDSKHHLLTEWDPNRRRDAANDPVFSKVYEYNTYGQVTSIGTPAGLPVRNEYDQYGRLVWSKDSNDNQTSYHYDETYEGQDETRGFLTSIHDAEGNETVYRYDAKGRCARVIDPEGRETTYEYDDLDRIKKVTGPGGATVETHYSCCRKTWEQDENGLRTYHVYDAKGRPFKEVTSAKSTTLMDPIDPGTPINGGSLELSDASGFPASGEIVVLDEIISYSGKDGNTLLNIQRAAETTHKVTAGEDEAVSLVGTIPVTHGYHGTYHDWMISTTDALGHTTYYTYYPNGRVHTVRYTDDKGERNTYDGAGNLTKKEYGSFSGTYPDQVFAADPDLTANYDYDANNRLLRTYH